MTGPATKPLHRIREVRRREGVSVRTMGTRLGQPAKVIQKLDHPATDMRLSDLHLIADALAVPASDLILDSDHDGVEYLRALVLRVAKIANTLSTKLQDGTPAKRLADSIKATICEAMPCDELGELHEVGMRRSMDELGRAAVHVVPTYGVTRMLADDPTADTRRQR